MEAVTLHLTGCWYPGVDDDTLRGTAEALRDGSLRLVWFDGNARTSFNVLCADALERMAGTPKETT